MEVHHLIFLILNTLKCQPSSLYIKKTINSLNYVSTEKQKKDKEYPRYFLKACIAIKIIKEEVTLTVHHYPTKPYIDLPLSRYAFWEVFLYWW